MFQSYTNIHICCWTPGCTDQKCKGTGLLLLQFYAVYWEIKCNTVCPVCLSVIQQGAFPSTPGVFVLITSGARAGAQTGSVPHSALANSSREHSQEHCCHCSGFSWLWSVWETWSKIICSSWEFRYKSVPVVPFCNMQIIMNICIFLHFCVWYMYYLRQML